MTINSRVLFVIPVFNESLVIENYIKNLDSSFKDFFHTFIVVNDKSTDDSFQILSRLEKIFPLQLINNPINLGHGASLTKGLNHALDLNSEYIISLDGDANFDTFEIKSLFEKLISDPTLDLIESFRVNRSEPIYRRIVSYFTKVIIFIKTGNLVKDANTPLRLYKYDALNSILPFIPKNTLVPNLHVTIISRRNKLKMISMPVKWQNLKKVNPSSTWNFKSKIFPPLKFITFCVKAFREFAK
ncbi:MAG: glycosyltransferase family 2 protein [Chitinophagia bacterium]|nr:glycosyltransferase family 2 protein [Chitinophagia bacterium]